MELFPDEVRLDQAELRRAYLRLALSFHPDKQQQTCHAARVIATAEFARISTAYEQLSARLSGAAGPQGQPLGTALAAACELGDVGEVRRLVQKRPEVASKPDALGAAPLMFAAKGGSGEVCQLLLSARAGVDATDPLGWTALAWAALHDQVSAVRVLLGAGAAVSQQALVLAAFAGRAGALAALAAAAPLGQAPLVRTEQAQQSLLHVAVQGLVYMRSSAEAHLECMEVLLQARCDPCAEDKQGRTVLFHYLSEFGEGKAATRLQASRQHAKAVRRLCEMRADPMATGPGGRTALELAGQRGLARLRRELLRAVPGAHSREAWELPLLQAWMPACGPCLPVAA